MDPMVWGDDNDYDDDDNDDNDDDDSDDDDDEWMRISVLHVSVSIFDSAFGEGLPITNIVFTTEGKRELFSVRLFDNRKWSADSDRWCVTTPVITLVTLVHPFPPPPGDLPLRVGICQKENLLSLQNYIEYKIHITV